MYNYVYLFKCIYTYLRIHTDIYIIVLLYIFTKCNSDAVITQLPPTFIVETVSYFVPDDKADSSVIHISTQEIHIISVD